MSNSIYRKLTPKKRSLGGFSQAWLGPDHLLVIRSSRIAENYQRFSFADIQAIVIQDRPDRTVWQVVAVFASITWGCIEVVFRPGFAKWFFAATGLLAFLAVVVDIARGPRCRCFLYTAVNRQMLPSVSRRRVARNFLAKLIPAIESVQGSFPADGLSPAGAASEASSPEAPPEIRRPPNYAAPVLFGMFLVDSILVWATFNWTAAGAAALLPIVYLTEITLAVVAILRGRSGPARVSFVIAVVALVCALVDAVAVGGAAALTALVNNVLKAQNKELLDPIWLSIRATSMLATGWRVAAGLGGLAAVYFEKRGQGK